MKKEVVLIVFMLMTVGFVYSLAVSGPISGADPQDPSIENGVYINNIAYSCDDDKDEVCAAYYGADCTIDQINSDDTCEGKVFTPFWRIDGKRTDLLNLEIGNVVEMYVPNMGISLDFKIYLDKLISDKHIKTIPGELIEGRGSAYWTLSEADVTELKNGDKVYFSVEGVDESARLELKTSSTFLPDCGVISTCYNYISMSDCNLNSCEVKTPTAGCWWNETATIKCSPKGENKCKYTTIKEGDCENEGDEIILKYTPLDPTCPDLEDQVVPCIDVARLSFFSFFSFILSMSLISLIYVILILKKKNGIKI